MEPLGAVVETANVNEASQDRRHRGQAMACRHLADQDGIRKTGRCRRNRGADRIPAAD